MLATQEGGRRATFNLNVINGLLAISVLAGIFTTFLLSPLFGDDFITIRTIQRLGVFSTYVTEMYQSWTGRVPQIVLLWMGLQTPVTRVVLQVASFLTALSVVWLAAAIPLGRWPRVFGRDQLYFLLVGSAIWFGNPAIDEIVFWRTGATAYLYSGLFLLLFLRPYVWALFEPQQMFCPAIQATEPFAELQFGAKSALLPLGSSLFCIGALAGCCHEQVALSLAAFVMGWIGLSLRQGRLGLAQWPFYAGIVGLIFGLVVLGVAPGNQTRFHLMTSISFTKKIKIGLLEWGDYVFSPQLMGWLFLILLCAVVGATSKVAKKESQTRMWIALSFLLLGLFSLWLTLAFNVIFSPRVAYFSVLYVVMGAACLFVHFDGASAFTNALQRAMCTAILLVLCFDTATSIHSAAKRYKAVKHREETIAWQKQKGFQDVYVRALPKSFLGKRTSPFDAFDLDQGLVFGFDYNDRGELQLVSPLVAATWTYPYGYAPKTLIEHILLRLYHLKDASKVENNYCRLTCQYMAEFYGVRSISLVGLVSSGRLEDVLDSEKIHR